jgi:hypothetical protein
MYEYYPASLQNVGGSTQELVPALNNVQKGTCGIILSVIIFIGAPPPPSPHPQ